MGIIGQFTSSVCRQSSEGSQRLMCQRMGRQSVMSRADEAQVFPAPLTVQSQRPPPKPKSFQFDYPSPPRPKENHLLLRSLDFHAVGFNIGIVLDGVVHNAAVKGA